MRTALFIALASWISLCQALTQEITFDFSNPSTDKVGNNLGQAPIQIANKLTVNVINIDSSVNLGIAINKGSRNLESIPKGTIAREFENEIVPGSFSFTIEGASIVPYEKVIQEKPFFISIINGDKMMSSIEFTSGSIAEAGGSGSGGQTDRGMSEIGEDGRFYKNKNNIMEPFKDAVSLGYFLTEKQSESRILDIMHDYFSIDSAAFNRQALLDSLNNIPDAHLLKTPFSVMSTKAFGTGTGAQSGDDQGLDKASGSASSILTSPTILIDALAQLIAKRFKEELSIAYIEKFKAWLQNNHVDKLLPHTYRVITFQNPVNYKTFLPLVRSALHQDYMDAPDNMYTFAGQPEIRSVIKSRNPNVYTGLMGGLYILKRRADLPADILEEVVNEEFIKHGNEELLEYLTFLKALSVNLRADDTYTGWVKTDDLQRLLVGNKTNLQLFAGLLFLKEGRNRGAKHKGLLVGNIVLDSLRADKHENVERFFKVYRSIQDVQANVEAVDFQKIVALDQDVKIQAQIQRAKQLQKVLLSTLVVGREIGTLSDDQFKKLNSILDEIMTTIESAYSREYGGIVNGILTIMSEVGLDLGENFTKYATFTVNLLNAQNSNDALIALETMAMPVGGYRVKRKSKISASITSYPGLFGASEMFRGNSFDIAKAEFDAEGEEISTDQFTFGFTAPVGISFDFGVDRDDDSDIPGSFSLMVSVIDIGSVVSLRLEDNVSTLPELKWSNVVAPGVYASIGFRNTPLTAIFGYQYGPNLREISLIKDDMGATKTEVTFEPSAHRWGAAFTVDIALLNIFAKGR